MKPALFSANSEGACANCNGAGVIYTDLAMMAGVAVLCEVCEGKRFQVEVLKYKLGGKDISEVLAMPVLEAAGFFGAGEGEDARGAHDPRPARRRRPRLPHPRPAASHALRRRAPAAEAGHADERRRASVYVLDEPTAGLHLADVEQLLGLLDRLVDSGKSAIVIEHHQAVMAHADWIIDLGPGAGHEGGRIVFEGTPAELVAGQKGGRGRAEGNPIPHRRAPRGLRRQLTPQRPRGHRETSPLAARRANVTRRATSRS